MSKSLACAESDILHCYVIFAHNGKLISYINIKERGGICKTCYNTYKDCVYIKDGDYYTLFPKSILTVIDCEIKCKLRPIGAILMDSDIGTFVMLNHQDFDHYQKILLLRGVRLDYIPKKRGWLTIFYLNHLCEKILQNVVFTSLIDDDNNVYLIDKNGNTLKYEILTCTDEKRTYANDRTSIKICRKFESSEILTNREAVGKHTKPALRGADE